MTKEILVCLGFLALFGLSSVAVVLVLMSKFPHLLILLHGCSSQVIAQRDQAAGGVTHAWKNARGWPDPCARSCCGVRDVQQQHFPFDTFWVQKLCTVGTWHLAQTRLISNSTRLLACIIIFCDLTWRLIHSVIWCLLPAVRFGRISCFERQVGVVVSGDAVAARLQLDWSPTARSLPTSELWPISQTGLCRGNSCLLRADGHFFSAFAL